MSAGLTDAILAALREHPDGMQTLALLPLAGGNERRLCLLLWDLAVEGRITVRFAEGDAPELILPGPCHAVAQRFAAICPWCRDRVAALQGAKR